VQIQYKPEGTPKWLIPFGAFPPDWNAACGDAPSDTAAPVPALQPPEGGTDFAPDSCAMWRVNMWQLDGGSGALRSVSQWVFFSLISSLNRLPGYELRCNHVAVLTWCLTYQSMT
jgi:hypothetical protein